MSGTRNTTCRIADYSRSRVPGALERHSRGHATGDAVVRQDRAEEVLAWCRALRTDRRRVQVHVSAEAVRRGDIGLRRGSVVEPREVAAGVWETSHPDQVRVTHRGDVHLVY